MAQGEKSLDQLIPLAISMYYNWDITNREKDKRHEFTTMVDRRGTSAKNA
jgi:hypothetical protein